jgi:hypothetical protein
VGLHRCPERRQARRYDSDARPQTASLSPADSEKEVKPMAKDKDKGKDVKKPDRKDRQER